MLTKYKPYIDILEKSIKDDEKELGVCEEEKDEGEVEDEMEVVEGSEEE